ncbi:MAG: aminopeptidase P family protein [Candidatus Delongbacteria bacterium]|nr:aminopeptidase P family protein [Candidatus Delongbacteria bacterium]
MYNPEIYQARRNALAQKMDKGMILWVGNEETPRNYPKNTYPFRQDSSFLYYFGLAEPHLAVWCDLDREQEWLVGEELTIDDIIWTGEQPSLADKAAWAGLSGVIAWDELKSRIDSARADQAPIHFLPPYQDRIKLLISQWLELNPLTVVESSSSRLVQAVIEQRSVKAGIEIDQIEKALEISYAMVQTAVSTIRPGKTEQQVLAGLDRCVADFGSTYSFAPILTIHGEVFHNTHHENQLRQGHLILMDMGAESPEFYASDITRTYPVGGRFSTRRRDIYQVVLQAQLHAIRRIGPGIPYRDIHLEAAVVIVDGLKELGLMQGNTEEAVMAGAHALFFPHGLGHMLGLDVHDMENLGEDRVGYNDQIQRSRQFGLSYLRLAKPLQPGYVLTVEPGLYFIPALIDHWRATGRFTEFIQYSRLDDYRTFGGIRIEDDVVVTPTGCRVLGRPIPKSIDEIESALLS